ncbi:hypothetical protein HYD_2300 [Candidatus Hydrogenosomobacter endosymbioticus]|uniref:Uncharacterized protein n=2 Tax=Candidatus Hydrogenosomobacter endosymbioticus TaxID=2558174 RepID=A0ABM7V8I4_9PROT|nr:hypothetical protein HYD_2300 [Candidatus Hydrogenosomobacter endosymbioticus]
MKKYLESGKIVFVDVTASWCFSCQMNKQLILKEHSVQRELAAPGIVAMIADYTSQSDDIRQFLRTHKRVGIPFNVIISKWYPQGIILSERLSAAEIIHALRLMEKLKQDR